MNITNDDQLRAAEERLFQIEVILYGNPGLSPDTLPFRLERKSLTDAIFAYKAQHNHTPMLDRLRAVGSLNLCVKPEVRLMWIDVGEEQIPVSSDELLALAGELTRIANQMKG